MNARKRGSVQVRGNSISVVLDLGEQPWRRCPTARCSGSVFTDSRGPLSCERCGGPLADPVPHRRRVWHSGFRTKAEANRALTRLLGSVDAGSFVEPSAVTLREFVETSWLPSLKAGTLRPSTVEMYQRSATRYVVARLGSVRLRDLTPARLTSWIDALKSEGVGARTVEIAAITAHKILKAALDLELIPRNPADNAAVRAARPHPKAKEPTVWSAEETRAFLAAQEGDRLFALWRLAAMTGLRRGELAGLTWSAVDLDAASLAVVATVVVVSGRAVPSSPKTAKSARVIGLDPATVAALRSHRATQAAERLRAGELWRDSDAVFCDELGRPYHPNILTRTLARQARAAGLPVVKLHALRHGHATHALEAGVDLTVMSARLGHSSVAITGDIYSHVTRATDSAAAARVAAAVDGL